MPQCNCRGRQPCPYINKTYGGMSEQQFYAVYGNGKCNRWNCKTCGRCAPNAMNSSGSAARCRLCNDPAGFTDPVMTMAPGHTPAPGPARLQVKMHRPGDTGTMIRCSECDHEWDETRYQSHRKCPSCRNMVGIPECRKYWLNNHPEVPVPGQIPPTPKAGTLPPQIVVALDPTAPQDHSYVKHNPYKEIADGLKKKWPGYEFPI